MLGILQAVVTPVGVAFCPQVLAGADPVDVCHYFQQEEPRVVFAWKQSQLGNVALRVHIPPLASRCRGPLLRIASTAT
jgi:hypothetical protein